MDHKGDLLCWKVVEDDAGKRFVYSVHKKGGSIRIVSDRGYEHLMNGTAAAVDTEIMIVFEVRVVETATPAQGRPSLD